MCVSNAPVFCTRGECFGRLLAIVAFEKRVFYFEHVSGYLTLLCNVRCGCDFLFVFYYLLAAVSVAFGFCFRMHDDIFRGLVSIS